VEYVHDTKRRSSAKLRVGSANDVQEREAERAAAAVVRRLPVRPDDEALLTHSDPRVPVADATGGATRIRRATRGPGGPAAAPAETSRIRPRTGAPVIRRLLDEAYEDDVFDIAQGKREAEVSNMQLGSKGIGANDPRRQTLESFFSDPAKQKGSRSSPAKLTGGSGAARAAGPGQLPSAPLPGVMVVGADATTAPRSKEQADAEHKIHDIAQAAVAKTPSLSGVVQALKSRALTSIAAMGKNKLAKMNRSIGQDDDMAALAAEAKAIVDQFQADVTRKAEAATWEATVDERNAFVAGKPNPAMAAQALERAKQAIPLAAQIYDLIYAPLDFADASIARVTALNAEQRLVNLQPTMPGTWQAFVKAATAVDKRLQFALDNAADLATVAAPGPALRVWFANPTKIANAAEAQAILGLSLVGNDPVVGAKAARQIGLSMIPDLATLTTINDSGLFDSIADIADLAALGGDLVTSKAIRELDPAPADKHISAFNAKAGTTATQVAASWTHLTTTIADDTVRGQIVSSLALAPDAGKTDLTRMVDNWAAMSNRTTVEGDVVAQLVSKGMLVARGKTYDSGTWGKGAVYTFELAGGGRIHAEWHIHFQSAGGKREATVAGAGWKNASQKYGVGQKSFDGNETKLVKAMRDTGKWIVKSF
jgi:hypothetical protein